MLKKYSLKYLSEMETTAFIAAIYNECISIDQNRNSYQISLLKKRRDTCNEPL